MVSTRYRFAAIAATAMLACGPAAAATVTECIADVQVLQDTINAATTFTTLNEQVAKLVAANKPKLGTDDGAAITAKDNVAGACVTQLLTQ